MPLLVSLLVVLVAIILGIVVYERTNSVVMIVHQSHSSFLPLTPKNEQTPLFHLQTLYFPCSGVKCEAYFYLPKTNGQASLIPPPVIVMAPGFGSQKDFMLEKFAQFYVTHGYAVFLFDYRTFGGSEGEPQNFVTPTGHLQDWESALDFVTTMDPQVVNTQKLILSGISFSGGHVIVTAAKSAHKGKIAAVLSQVPFLRVSPSTALVSIPYVAKLFFFGVLDKVRQWLGYSRYYVPIFGTPDELAILASPSSSEYTRLIPKFPRGGWQNKCPAYVGIASLLYNPYTFAADVKAPVLIVYGTEDDLCLEDEVKDTAKKIPNVELKRISTGHFGIYFERYEENVEAQLEFLQKYVEGKE